MTLSTSAIRRVVLACLVAGACSTPAPTPPPQPDPESPDAVVAPDAPPCVPAEGAPLCDEVVVDAGPFWMGCNETLDAQCGHEEYPQHEVSLSAFAISKTEVTVAQFAQCVAAGACETPEQNDDLCTWSKSAQDQHPVNCVRWSQAAAYCQWAGGRLPTEAEWEKAARGTDGAVYPWGADPPSCKLVNYWSCDGTLDPVGSHPDGASPYGALDMAGNVWEWTADWYEAGYYDSSPAVSPLGPDAGEGRTIRGGSFLFYEGDGQRTSIRGDVEPDAAWHALGFRCVRSL